MSNENQKILITGATGAIGRHLVKALLEKGYYCRCLVRKTSNVAELKKAGVELFYGDICEPESLNGIAQGIDIVYHLAAEGHVSSSSDDAYKKFLKINVEGTKNLAKECIRSGVKKFIHFSSTAAMGLIEDIDIDETTPCVPQTPYQKAKYQSEVAVLELWKKEKLPALILRPCMVYGENCKGEYLRIFSYMKKGIFPRLGAGKKLTPLVYITNLVHAAINAATSGEPGNVYLLVDQSVELDELRQKVIALLGVNPRYLYVPPRVAVFLIHGYETFSNMLRIEPKVTVKNIKSTIADRIFNTEKARRDLNFQEVVGLDEALKTTITWATAGGYL